MTQRAIRPAGRRLRAGLLLVALALVVACGRGGEKQQAATATSEPHVFDATLASATPEPTATETPTPPAVLFPTPSPDARIARLIIPAAKVNAPVQVKGVNARNEMENPDGKDNVAWYNFTDRPGFGPNAVFSGHVDWYTGEQGVFWYLRDLKAGDEVIVRMTDGSELHYRVTENKTYPASEAPVAEIIGPTPTEVVTLITCDGVFDRRSQDYNLRRVVRAERVG
jgi:LPXTG-site transpeptidase (sortase) family protein